MLSRRLRSSPVARAASLTVVVAILAAPAGCSTIRSMMPEAREAKRTQLELQQLQAKYMRYADVYVGRVVEETGRFQRWPPTRSCGRSSRSGRCRRRTRPIPSLRVTSALVSALDLVTLAVLSRMVIEDSIVPRFPSETGPLLAMHRELEQRAWKLTDEFLTPVQTEDFRNILVEWRASNPSTSRASRSSILCRFRQGDRATGSPAKRARRGNLFGLLGLETMSSLDPAVRQIKQTRLLAERVIYYLQRDAVHRSVSSSGSLTNDAADDRPRASGDPGGQPANQPSQRSEFAGVAEGLPQALAHERGGAD